MRSAELVRRAEQNVAAELAHVDRLVRSEVHRVDPRDRARVARERADALRVRERPGRVRRQRERDHPRSLGELTLQIVVVDRQLVRHTGDPHGQPLVGGELDPGRHAAVVIELGGQHLVAGLKVAPGGA